MIAMIRKEISLFESKGLSGKYLQVKFVDKCQTHLGRELLLVKVGPKVQKMKDRPICKC